MKRLLVVFVLLVAAPAAMMAAYTYFRVDTLTGPYGSPWQVNGVVTPTSSGMTSRNTNGGSLIYGGSIPDGTSDYEVKSIIDLSENSGGTYYQYLRASTDAMAGPAAQGSFYSVEVQSPSYNSTHRVRVATLAAYKRVGGVLTQLASVELGCQETVEVRSILRGTRIDVWVDGVLYLSLNDTALATGKPGIGIRDAGDNSVASVSLGGLDRTAPPAVSTQSIASYPAPTSVDLQWQGLDNTNGIGVGRFLVYRNGVFLEETIAGEFTDENVTPDTPYTYGLVARDYHLNDSPQTTFSVRTPLATAVDPRRTGVRKNGSYWGAGGEQIDTLSGNLNFTLPLLTAQARNGWSATFALSHNSQLWRKDPAATWKLGRDVGYGFGWRLQVGSLTPYWEDVWTIHHYTFTDSTGAEYRLDVPDATGEKWTSKEGIHLTYDRVANRLYFPDGGFWVMGCISSGEQDTGTRYPTVLQDVHGNQIIIRYLAGRRMAWDNTSARIQFIEDVRATDQGGTYPYRSFDFTYNSDTIPHLTQIDFRMGLSRQYQFSYLASQNLNSPFSPPVAFGTAHLLSSVSEPALSVSHGFQYDAGGSGELTKVTFPYGGYLRWTYQDALYSGSRTQRSVASRYLAKSGGTETAYVFTAGTPGDTVRPYTLLDDPGGTSQKAWYFTTSGLPWQIGLLNSFEQRPGSGQTSERKQQYTWAADLAGSNPYISAVVTTLDEGPSTEVVSKTEQDLDGNGNLLETRIYGFGNLTELVRKYTNTYLNTTPYLSRHILNRLLTSKVSVGTQELTLVSNTYDVGVYCGGNSMPPTSLREFDRFAALNNPQYRGLLSYSTSNGIAAEYWYNSCTGRLTGASSQGRSISIAVAPGTNEAVPGVITPNGEANLAESATWTAFLGIATDTQPNSSVASNLYDSYARPTSTTSRTGAVTNYTYDPANRTTTATTNGRWVKSTTDGLGRTVKVESGNGTTTVSIVDTEYDSCACSPMGKVKRVSLPYAPGGTVQWTTHSYDCLGRTTQVEQPGGTGHTHYAYQGNTVTVTDPKDRWKKYIVDVLGNLVQVTEQGPGSDPNHETNYAYNLRNQLTEVSMPRGGTTQTRTFNYDLGTGRLTSMAQPETGATSYTYNSNGLPATRTDAKNQQVQYQYDSHRRVTQIRRYPVAGGAEDTCQRADFYYDLNTLLPSYTQNGWGRLVAMRWGGSTCLGGEWAEMYSYTPAGLPTKKYLKRYPLGSYVEGDSEVFYTYDGEGRTVSLAYGGQTYTYSFDSMGRPNKLTDNQATPLDWAKDVVYNVAGQITQMKYSQSGTSTYYTETREFNVLGQVTHMTVPGVRDFTYTFSATQNDGRITQMTDAISGEIVQYQYDSLKRLTSAETTGPQWGQSFQYDGFGNLLSQIPTKGQTPPLYVNVEATTNRIAGEGYTYDANGNLTAMSGMTMTYAVENRLVEVVRTGVGTEKYVYNPRGERVWQWVWQSGWSYPQERIYLYGVEGNLLTTRSGTSSYKNVYFGRRQVYRSYIASSGTVHEDRLGSAVRQYFPYGDEPATTTQNRVKFATYFRDETTALDYARNRYYSSSIARFTTADTYGGSARPGNPQSWNRYTYVGGDPVNRNDPSGLWPPCDIWDWQCPAELLPVETGGGGGGGWGGYDPCYRWADGFMPVPNPACFLPLVALPPPQTRQATCGDVVGPLMPADAEGRNMIAVLLGEDSWWLIGSATLPGATASSGTRITAEDVALEEAMMVATMINLADAYRHSVDWTITNNQYLGYAHGWQMLNDALDTSPFSSECDHLLTAIGALIVGPTVNVPYTQWGAALPPGGGVRPLLPGDLRIAGTDFFGPRATIRRKRTP